MLRDRVQRVAVATLVVLTVLTGVCGAIVGVLTVSAAGLEVVNRELLAGRVGGLDEVAEFSFGWFVAFAAGFACAVGTHYRIVYVVRVLARRHSRAVSEWIYDVTGLALGAVLLKAGIEWLPQARIRHALTLNITLYWPHFSVVVLGALLIVCSALRLFAGRHVVAHDDRFRATVIERI